MDFLLWEKACGTRKLLLQCSCKPVTYQPWNSTLVSTDRGNRWMVTLPCDQNTRRWNPKAEKVPGLELETLEIGDPGRKKRSNFPAWAPESGGGVWEVCSSSRSTKRGCLRSSPHRELLTPQPPILLTYFPLGTVV